jgi:hypothetical protein
MTCRYIDPESLEPHLKQDWMAEETNYDPQYRWNGDEPLGEQTFQDTFPDHASVSSLSSLGTSILTEEAFGTNFRSTSSPMSGHSMKYPEPRSSYVQNQDTSPAQFQEAETSQPYVKTAVSIDFEASSQSVHNTSPIHDAESSGFRNNTVEVENVVSGYSPPADQSEYLLRAGPPASFQSPNPNSLAETTLSDLRISDGPSSQPSLAFSPPTLLSSDSLLSTSIFP